MPPSDADSPYLYPGTRVLRNKPGIRDGEALRKFEYQQTEARIWALRARPLRGNYDLDHLKAIHKHVFQDVYAWAGELRTVSISKGGTPFAEPPYIEGEAQRLSMALAQENYLKGLDKAQFVERFAHYYAEWNALHPFREGNGRATRVFLGELAREAGYELYQQRIDNDLGEWNDASEASFFGQLGPVIKLFNQAIRPSRAVAFEQLPEKEALAQFPELKDAFETLAKLREALHTRYPADAAMRDTVLGELRAQLIEMLDTGARVAPVPPDRSEPPDAER